MIKCIDYKYTCYLRVPLGSSKFRWIPVDSMLFDEFYFNDLYCIKEYSCVRHGFRHDYYTFYLQRSNGLVKPNSTVKFMVVYGVSNYE